MKGETPDQALMRAAVVAGYRAAEDAARVADRMVIDRIISRDEDGEPRRLVPVDEPQIEDAALREALGLF